jgi:hypothetical protein
MEGLGGLVGGILSAMAIFYAATGNREGKRRMGNAEDFKVCRANAVTMQNGSCYIGGIQ